MTTSLDELVQMVRGILAQEEEEVLPPEPEVPEYVISVNGTVIQTGLADEEELIATINSIAASSPTADVQVYVLVQSDDLVDLITY